ncbi:MAG: L-threonine 3-dehydrogenase [Synergistaceae bacterium]|jgi:threonine 3-dehydrogenase|nr:L-threonine 3-dehydrogenase [Synergistaceae bacterium]
MRAWVKNEPKKGMELVDIPVPKPGEGEVLVKVLATAICGTDLHLYEWNAWAQGAVSSLPLVLGHEFCGEIAEVGKDVTRYKTGDYVSADSHVVCGTCYQCLNGMQHICGNLKILGVHIPGCFAEYIAVPEHVLWKISRDIKPEFGAIMEPLGVGVHAIHRGEVQGARMVVQGCGPIGLGAIAAAQAMGAAEILAVDVSETRLDFAKQLGAQVLNPTKTDIQKCVMEMTQGTGADVIVEATGNAKAVSAAFKFLRKGGRALLVGLPSEPVTFDLVSDIVFKEATVMGFHGREMYQTWTVMDHLMQQGKLKLEPLVSHILPLEKAEEAMELLLSGQGSKVVLKP